MKIVITGSRDRVKLLKGKFPHHQVYHVKDMEDCFRFSGLTISHLVMDIDMNIDHVMFFQARLRRPFIYQEL